MSEEISYTQADQDAVVQKLVTARIALLMKHPFFGNLAARLVLKDASSWCTTAATEGRHIYYSVPFFKNMSLEGVQYVVAHEVLHVVFDHMGRIQGRDKKLSNIAADYAVNQILKDENIGRPPEDVKPFQDDKYRGWTYEQIYNDLLEQQKNGKDQSQPSGSDGQQVLDEHLDGEGDGEGDENGGNGRPKLTEAERAQIRDEVKEAMIAAAQASGKVPASLARLIKDFTEPKMNWREVLRMSIQSCLKSNYSFSRPNRKSQGCGAVLPGLLNDDTISVFCSIDTSGSISNEMVREFLSEVKGIMDQYTDFSLDVSTFDTNLYNHQHYEADNADDIHNYEIKGGGGTDATCVWEYLKENQIEPKKIIIFTDGYISDGDWGDEDYADTLFLIHGTDSIRAPFGETVYYD